MSAGVEHQVHAAGQGECRLAGAQALHGEVDRDQRRRARCVDGTLGPCRSSRYDSRPDASARAAGAGVDVERFGLRLLDILVVARGHPTKTLARVPARATGDARVLDRLPGDLEQQPLLGIHPRRLPGEIPKKAASKRSTPSSHEHERVEIMPSSW